MLIAQITDAHIVPPGLHWKGEPSTQIELRMIRAISYLNEIKPDAVVFTGDAADEGDAESYRHFREIAKPLRAPLFVLPGNHDSREEMREAFSDYPYLSRRGPLNFAIEEFPVRLIGLDTTVPDEDYGRVDGESLDWMQKTLEKDSEKPALLFMHHPPVKVGAKTFDTKYSCLLDPAFEDLVRESGSLLGIAAGHYHHLCASAFGGKPCFIAPSLAPTHYFAHPDDPDPAALELDDPGVTLHRFLGAGAVSTHVVRLKEDWRRIPILPKK